jgi:hypothetical protein
MSLSNAYADNERWQYKGIQLRLAIDSEAPAEEPLLDQVTMEARITLRHTRNAKRDGSHNHVVVLDRVVDLGFNAMNPLKLLLAHALR